MDGITKPMVCVQAGSWFAPKRERESEVRHKLGIEPGSPGPKPKALTLIHSFSLDGDGGRGRVLSSRYLPQSSSPYIVAIIVGPNIC